MARFYNTTQRNFVDDFIFQPNWELAATALGKKDAEIQGNLDTLELFRNLPIDYWKEADQDEVDLIKNEYESRVDDITSQLQTDLLNPNNKQAINRLRRDIERDYDSGRIRDIQDNAARFREWDARRQALSDPSTRQMYGAAIEEYLSQDREGRGLFSGPELFDRRDIWQEFTSSDAFKNLQADLQASQLTNINGQWMVKEGNEIKSLSETKIGQAFEAFVRSSGLEGYGASRQRYGGEQWIDDSGNVRMDSGSYLGDIMQTGIPSLAYTQQSQSRDMSVNPYVMARYQSRLQEQMEIRREARQQRYAQLAAQAETPQELSKKATFAQKISRDHIDIVNNKLNELKNKYDLKNINVNSIPVLIEYAKNNDLPLFRKDLEKLQTTYQEGLRASYEPLSYMGYTQKQIDDYKNNLTTGVELKGANVKGYIDLAGSGIDTKGDLSRHLSPNELLGKSLGGRRIIKAQIVKGSSTPVFFGQSDMVNQIQSTLELEFEPITDQFGNITDEYENRVRQVDFYQKTSDISGNNIIQSDILNSR